MIAIGEQVPDITLRWANDTPCALSGFAGRKLLLVFVRHLGCIACHAHLDKIDKNYKIIRDAGAEVLAVSMRPPEFLRQFLKQSKWSVPIVCDPDRTAYRLFGLERASWTTYFRPIVVVGYLALMFRGWMPGMPVKGEDIHQLGGDFIVDRDRRLIYAHQSRDPSRSAPIGELMNLLTK
jgi:peroxiredoxin